MKNKTVESVKTIESIELVGNSEDLGNSEDSEDDTKYEAVLAVAQKKDLKDFKKRIAMFDKLKRSRERKKLKQEKLRLLSELLTINKKLKVLDEFEKEKEK